MQFAILNAEVISNPPFPLSPWLKLHPLHWSNKQQNPFKLLFHASLPILTH